MMTWENGLTEAIERLRAHLRDTHVRFDARDRAALDYVLTFAEDIERDSLEKLQREREAAGLMADLARKSRACPACELPTLRLEGLCASCQP